MQLARHFQLAGQAGKAIHYLESAVQTAARKSAYVEAERHSSLALDLLAGLPLTPERNEQELRIQVALGQMRLIAKGFGVPEVAQAFNRARELCQQVGEGAQIFSVLYGLSMYYYLRAELHTAQELAQQHLCIAQRQADETLLMLAHRQLGLFAFNHGELAASQTYLAQLIARYDPQQHQALVLRYRGSDSGVFGRFQMANTLWLLGYPDQAQQHVVESIALARVLPHPLSLVMALAYASLIHLYRGEVGAARVAIDEAVVLAAEHEFTTPKAIAITLQGQVMIAEGAITTGVARLEQGLADRRATGTESSRSHELTWLAEAYGRAGQIQQGLAVTAEIAAFMAQTDERFWAAEYHHVKGKLLLLQGAEAGEVEGCYRQGIAIARRQAARSLELRATMSLCRLWQQQGKSAAAQQHLAAIVGWFSEGFDTADLIEARALLAELD